MMSKIYRVGGNLSDWMGNNAGVVVTFIIGQGITALIFLTLLAGRVTTIETRGSPEVVMLERRVAAVESRDSNQEKQLNNIDSVSVKMTALDVRLTAVEVKQSSVLETLKANGGKLDHAIDILNAHMAGEVGNNRNSGRK